MLSFIRKLFGNDTAAESPIPKSAPQQTPAMPIAPRVSVNVLVDGPPVVDIPELDFIGTMVQSHSKEFTCAFGDNWKTHDEMRIGFRESGDGTVVLIRGGQMLWHKKVPRPDVAAVSDKGDVAVCDLGFGTGLKSTLLLFDVDGRLKVEDKIKANSFSCAVTPEGEYAVFSSCASDYDLHSIKLFAYSIPSASRLFTADFRMAQIKQVSSGTGEIVVTADGLNFRYSLDGTLLNRVEVNRRCFEKEMSSAQYVAAYFILKGCNGWTPLSEEARSFLMDAYAQLSSRSHEYQARTFRDWGLLLLSIGDKAGAAERFQSALALNPRIGLKRKLGDLEKEPNADSHQR